MFLFDKIIFLLKACQINCDGIIKQLMFVHKDGQNRKLPNSFNLKVKTIIFVRRKKKAIRFLEEKRG